MLSPTTSPSVDNPQHGGPPPHDAPEACDPSPVDGRTNPATTSSEGIVLPPVDKLVGVPHIAYARAEYRRMEERFAISYGTCPHVTFSETEVTCLEDFLEALNMFNNEEEDLGFLSVSKLGKIMMQNASSGRAIESDSPLFVQANLSAKDVFPVFVCAIIANESADRRVIAAISIFNVMNPSAVPRLSAPSIESEYNLFSPRHLDSTDLRFRQNSLPPCRRSRWSSVPPGGCSS